MKVEGPKEPLNILVMGSDNRDAPGQQHRQPDRRRRALGHHDPAAPLGGPEARVRHQHPARLAGRPARRATTQNGDTIPGGTDVMWNEAFSVGGPACTIQQFEQLTGIRIDHFVVVDFDGLPRHGRRDRRRPGLHPRAGIDDPAHGINIPAGTRKLEGQQALNYVRERYVLGNGSDIGRMKRQQAFIAVDGAPGGQRRHPGPPGPAAAVPRRRDQVADRSTRASAT